MDYKIELIILPVSDIERATAFYRALLAIDPRVVVIPGARRPETVASCRRAVHGLALGGGRGGDSARGSLLCWLLR